MENVVSLRQLALLSWSLTHHYYTPSIHTFFSRCKLVFDFCCGQWSH